MLVIPSHLREFVVDQRYEHYTPINQAVWRYVMRRHVNHLERTAHPVYVEGLRSSGISIEAIPDVAYMTECLSRYGWAAVAVDGIIPATVFMDFQAYGLLPISTDIRSHEHIAYTPAPDIIHETAGHAPILWDETYSRFMKLFGEVGAKALSSKEDHEVYEATRLVSIIKEDPEATPERIREAEAQLAEKVAAVSGDSEATLAGRLYWWTVEYGLIGDLERPQLYGAGLLSSVGESHHCLTEAVKKLPFDLDACIATPFDITNYQPQLFVARDFEQLIDAVETLRGRLAQSHGGTLGLRKAVDSARTATVELPSGLQWSGTFTTLLEQDGEAIYVATSGPSALAVANEELRGHGREEHPLGLASPIGRLAGRGTPPEALDAAACEELGLTPGGLARLRYASGIEVTGRVQHLERRGEALLFAVLSGARVTLGDEVLQADGTEPYVLMFGSRASSVYAGAADKERFYSNVYRPSAQATIRHGLSQREQRLQHLYAAVRDLRESGRATERDLVAIAGELDREFAEDWLLRLELLELALSVAPGLATRLHEQLEALAREPGRESLIRTGLDLLPV